MTDNPILKSLGDLIAVRTQAAQQKNQRRLQDAQMYQAQAAGDYDVARANDLTALSRAMAPFADAVGSIGLDAAMKNADLLAPLISAFKTPEAMSLLPGATPDQKMTFGLAGGQKYDTNNVFSIDDREAVAGRNAQNDEALEISKLLASPIDVSAGETVIPGVGDPRGENGPIYGRETDSQSRANLRSRILAGDPSLPANAPDLLRGGSGLSVRTSPDGGLEISFGDGGNMTPLPKTVANQQIEQNIALRDFQTTLGMMRDIASQDPTIFGVVGNMRRGMQATSGQMGALSKLLGADFDKTFAQAASQMAAAGVDARYYDPNLTGIEKLASLAAYQAASALAGQTGQGLSNRDVDYFRNLIGNPSSWLSTQQSFLAGIDQLEKMVQARLQATNTNINAGADTTAGGTVVVDGVRYSYTGRRTTTGAPIVRGPDGVDMVYEEN